MDDYEGFLLNGTREFISCILLHCEMRHSAGQSVGICYREHKLRSENNAAVHKLRSENNATTTKSEKNVARNSFIMVHVAVIYRNLLSCIPSVTVQRGKKSAGQTFGFLQNFGFLQVIASLCASSPRKFAHLFVQSKSA